MTNTEAIEALKDLLDADLECFPFLKDEWEDAIKKAIAALERDRWISVEERLPEQGKRYLVIRLDDVTKTQFIDILWYDAHDLWWNRLYKGQYNVTHYRPLPEPPKEGT